MSKNTVSVISENLETSVISENLETSVISENLETFPTITRCSFEQNGTTGYKSLDKFVRLIDRVQENNAKSNFELAFAFSSIKENELYRLAGYSNIKDFVNGMFGTDFKYSTVQAFVQIGTSYIQIIGNKPYSIIAHEIVDSDTGKVTIEDYKFSVFNQFKSIEPETLKNLDSRGVIRPDMSLREIRKALDDFINAPAQLELDHEAESNDDSDEYRKLVKKAVNALKDLFNKYTVDNIDIDEFAKIIHSAEG